MEAVVFISHSSRDRKTAETLCKALESRGISCWISSRDIGPGQNFQEAIVKAVRTARAMVMVFTSHANNSDEIKKELALASQHRLPVLPVRVEDVVPSDAFTYEFATRQWIDVFDDWERAVGQLAAHVEELVGKDGAAPRRVAEPRAKPAKTGRTWAIAGLAGAAVVTLVAAGIFWLRPHQPAEPLAAAKDVAGAVKGLAPPSGPGPAAVTIGGKWVSTALTNPYDRESKSVLHFDFDQQGQTLFGTVTEVLGEAREITPDSRGSKHGIEGGEVKGDSISFFTRSTTTSGDGEHPYQETYRGTIKGGAIDFVRQNNVPTGGDLEKFTATRE
jgi:TIR domain